MPGNNPYESSSSLTSNGSSTNELAEVVAYRWHIWRTVMWTILSTPLLAGVIAICFRFPIPFAGYANGIRAFIPAMLAAVIYGLIGGFLFQAVIGSVGGAFAALISFRLQQRTRWLPLIVGIVSALPGLILLSVLDWLIGPW